MKRSLLFALILLLALPLAAQRKRKKQRVAVDTILTAMLNDVRQQIWKAPTNTDNYDGFRRNLQRAHVDRLMQMMKSDAERHTDDSAAVCSELESIRSNASLSASRSGPASSAITCGT